MTFLAPSFLLGLPIVVAPLLLWWWRRWPRFKPQPWAAMAFLVQSQRTTSPVAAPNRCTGAITIALQMAILVVILLFFAKPVWNSVPANAIANIAPTNRTSIVVSEAAGPNVARCVESLALAESLHPTILTLERDDAVLTSLSSSITQPSVIFLGTTAEHFLERLGLPLSLTRHHWVTPRVVTLETNDIHDPIVAPLVPHLGKFQLTLRSVWMETDSDSIAESIASLDQCGRTVLTARDSDGNRFPLVSVVSLPSGASRVVWYTSPEADMSSLGASPIFPVLLGQSLRVASSNLLKAVSTSEMATLSVSLRLWLFGVLTGLLIAETVVATAIRP